jgi:DNA-binding NtrC family response regulator
VPLHNFYPPSAHREKPAQQPATAQRPDLPAEAIPAAIMTLLQRHLWPANLRELANVMQAAVLLSDGKEIGPEHVPLRIVETVV